MKTALKYCLLLCFAVTLLQGCDFIRILAGRPTSVQIEQKRAAIDSIREQERQKLAEAELADSLARRHTADSLSAVDFLSSGHVIMKTLEESHLRIADVADSRYYVNLGAFKTPENARNLLDLVSEIFPEARILPFSNGLEAVVIPVQGDVVELRKVFKKVKDQSFCPPDIWVLDSSKK